MSATRNEKDDDATHRLELRVFFDNLAADEGKDEQPYTIHAELHRSCGGLWDRFLQLGINQSDLGTWLNFSGIFLSSLDALRNMAIISPEASAKLECIITPMMATQPSSDEKITKTEIEAISNMMEVKKIALENTHLLKSTASAEKDPEPHFLGELRIKTERPAKLFLRRGDHSDEMAKICVELTEAREHAATEAQRVTILQLINSFRTGDYAAFRDAHKTWVTDKAPRVEYCIGFLFGYRDPHGLMIIRTLPWAVPNENNGKRPFEPSELDVPDFAIIYVLASMSSTVWEATNIIIDSEGKRHSVKSIVYSNRISLNAVPSRPCFYVDYSESKAYLACAYIVRFIGTTIHELIGHGAGKLLAETSPGKFNFNQLHPPVNPLTDEPIQTWYKPGETWNSVFGKLAMTVEECRAFLTANYLADHKDILGLFGYDQTSVPTADDLIYNTYLHIGVEGLRALRSFNGGDQVWGGDHDQAQFAILKHILQDGGGVMRIEHDENAGTLLVRIDRSKIVSHGKSSIGRVLCKISIWHSTTDIEAYRPYYEGLSVVEGKYEQWRQIVTSNPEPMWKFVQPNTFIHDDGKVELREYEASNIGII